MLNNIQQAMNRIEQIEKRLDKEPEVNSNAFNQLFEKAS